MLVARGQYAAYTIKGWGERPIFGKIRYMNYNGALPNLELAKVSARSMCRTIGEAMVARQVY